jgi:hypothetical protein
LVFWIFGVVCLAHLKQKASSPIASPEAIVEGVSLFPVTPDRDDRDGAKIEKRISPVDLNIPFYLLIF